MPDRPALGPACCDWYVDLKKKAAVSLVFSFIALVVIIAVVLPDGFWNATGPTLEQRELSSASGSEGTNASGKTERLVRGDPRLLVVQNEDLPSQLVVGGGEYQSSNEFSQVYFNPQAYISGTTTNAELMGVIVNLSLLDDAVSANTSFTARGGLDPAAVMDDIRAAAPSALPRAVEPYAVTAADADRVLAFRVRYSLQGIDVCEYRYRVRVGNAVCNLIISARATAEGTEPAGFEGRAQAILDRQVARLVQARN